MDMLDKDIEILNELKTTISDRECTAIENVLSELETYKKIAEFLADKGNFDHYSYCESNIFSCNAKTPKKICKQCIIDWARKEVEKDD